LRKKGMLKRVRENKGGARPIRKPPPEYLEYLQSPHWLRFRVTVLEFWDYKCVICYDQANDVHHRTYDRMGHENLTDCVCLCRDCHKLVERRKDYLLKAQQGSLFGKAVAV
jgi:5-methylcytosine-specific restriction endonuclease McrA